MKRALKKKYLIVGAGPTGLGAAWRLCEKNESDWLIIDQHNYPGGLAASFKDDKGFTWDFAVHVAHSHYHYFDRLMDELLPDGFYHHQRKSWVRLYGTWVPYPFQYNFHRLPSASREACMAGLKNRPAVAGGKANFRDWIESSFGAGIAEHFMVPYNRKIWTVDPAEMNSHWLGDRVPTVDMEKVERNYAEGRDEVGWGPNATFQFPKKGGTGAIWKAMYERLPESNKRLSTRLVNLDVGSRTATLSDGSEIQYTYLISTLPIKILTDLVGDQALIEQAGRLRQSKVQVAGIGVYRPIPTDLADKTWVYCPEDKAAFYRVTPFSTFSPDHTPDPDACCSFLCEFARRQEEPFIDQGLGELAVEGLRALGFIDIKPDELHVYEMKSAYGYPVPTIDRDDILHALLPALEKMGIYSRGRFGGWKYEAANMDHSVMQGVEAVNHILDGADQDTIYRPNEVNRGKR